jgi:hypothetical protein
MKTPNSRITLTTLPAHIIYHAVLQFTQQQPLPRTRGRKPLYPYPHPHPRPAAHRPTHLVSPPALLPRPRSLARPAEARFGHAAVPPADNPRRTLAHAAELTGSAGHRPRDPQRAVADACGAGGSHRGGVQYAILCAVSSGSFASEGGGVGVLAWGGGGVVGWGICGRGAVAGGVIGAGWQ